MKIYLDYVLLVNFLYDFVILTMLALILKRNTTKKRLILASIFGAISSFILFLNISSFTFFILKMLTGLIMILIGFKYKSIKYTSLNFFYLMLLSIILGGSLYLINIETSYKHVGMIFFTKGNKINLLILLLISIIILYIYLKVEKRYQKHINTNYQVDIYLNNKKLKLNAFLDTGNNLQDPILKKPILIVNNNISIKQDKYILTPYHTIDGDGILKCYFVKKIYIHDIGYFKDVLVAQAPSKLQLPGVDMILNNKLLEEKK